MKLLNTNNCRSITAIQIERFIKKQKSRKLFIRMCNPDFMGTNELASRTNCMQQKSHLLMAFFIRFPHPE